MPHSVFMLFHFLGINTVRTKLAVICHGSRRGESGRRHGRPCSNPERVSSGLHRERDQRERKEPSDQWSVEGRSCCGVGRGGGGGCPTRSSRK